ncbi:MAG: hypothetical protein JW388_0251 [Nitrospira sp.]|nr:hypothetical protein [Nitrospira sp.]
MKRNALFEIQLFLFGAHLLVEIGANDSGGDAVDANIVLGQFARESTSDLRHGAFGGLIGNVRRQRADSGGRRNGDDDAFLLQFHVRHHGATEMINGVDMHVEGVHPLIWRDLDQFAIHGAASGMHEHIHRTQLGFCFAHDAGTVGGFAAIALNDFATPTERGDGGASRTRIGVGLATIDGDISAVFGECDGSGRADAFGAAGHESYFAVQIHKMWRRV